MTQTVERDESHNVEIKYDANFGFAITPETPHTERLEIGRTIGQFKGASTPMDVAMDQTVEVIGALYHPASLITYSGEEKHGTRVVLLLSTGVRLSSFSDAIKRFVDQDLVPLFAAEVRASDGFLLAKLTGPVSVLLERQPTKKGGPTYAPRVV